MREVVSIFDSQEKLQGAIDMLSTKGFSRNEISVIGSEKAMKERFNASYLNPKQIADNPNAPRSVNITTEEIGVAQGAVISVGILGGVIEALIAAGGVLAPAVIPATIIGMSAGAAIGGIVAKYIGENHSEHLQKQIEAGGIILWVQTKTPEKEQLALDIIKAHNPTYVYLHDITLEEA